MKITGMDVDMVRVTPWAEWIFVHIDTDKGICGLGEMNPGGRQSGALESLRQMEEALKGRDPRHIEQIVYDFTRGDPGPPQIISLCAVEQALWDILGKVAGGAGARPPGRGLPRGDPALRQHQPDQPDPGRAHPGVVRAPCRRGRGRGLRCGQAGSLRRFALGG